MDLAEPATGARTMHRASSRVAGILLFVLAAQFMLVIMLAASIAPDYDYGAAAISDLGVITQTALLFNVSLLAVGVLNIIGGYLHYRSHRKAWVLALFVLAGLGAIGAGSFPLDSTGPHGLFALLAFVAFNLEAIAMAAVVSGPMRVVGVLAGMVGLVFVVLMAIGDFGQHGGLRFHRPRRHREDDRLPGDGVPACPGRLLDGVQGRQREYGSGGSRGSPLIHGVPDPAGSARFEPAGCLALLEVCADQSARTRLGAIPADAR